MHARLASAAATASIVHPPRGNGERKKRERERAADKGMKESRIKKRERRIDGG
jgi:hypothetical protein